MSLKELRTQNRGIPIAFSTNQWVTQSTFQGSSESSSNPSLTCKSESDKSEVEESESSNSGIIEPHMFEPVASNLGGDDESEVEERRGNRDRKGIKWRF